MSKLITFGIPTYNGAKYLPQAIESVLEGITNENREEVEILISDNASTDNTSEIALNFQEKFPNLVRYTKNDVNIGFDRNVNQTIEKATGEFVWLLGDDDYLSPKGLQKIINKIKNLSSPLPAVLLAPADYHNISNNQITQGQARSHDEFCPNGDVFFQKSLWETACLSSIIVRRTEWIKLDFRDFFESKWIHIGGLIQIMKTNSAVIIDSPIIIVRTSNPRWQNNFGNQLLVGIEHLSVLSNLKSKEYKPETFEKFRRNRFSNNLMGILTMKPNNPISSLKIGIEMSKYFYMYWSFWMIHLPVLIFFPNLVALKMSLNSIGIWKKKQA